MKKKLHLVLALLALALTGASTVPDKKVETDPTLQRFKQYFMAKTNRTDLSRFKIEIKPLTKSSKIVHVTVRDSTPEWGSFYVIGDQGMIFNQPSPESLNPIFRSESVRYSTEEEKQLFIDRFVTLCETGSESGPPPKIIRSINDIPGYRKAPLDADLEPMIRAPWKTKDGILTIYTWIDGQVSRYQFKFEGDGRFSDATRTVLSDRVGDIPYVL